MKIVDLKIRPLNLEPLMALTVAYGSYEVFEYALLELVTDEGADWSGRSSPGCGSDW